MKLNPFSATSVGAVVVALFVCSLALPARAQFSPETKLSVGVFSRALVVQAFYRSAAWNAKVQTVIDQRKRAVAEGDAVKLDAIDRDLNDMQTLAQRQLTGEASLKNILDHLRAAWPAIAKEADVDIIVDSPIYLVPGVAVTDITPIVVKHLAGR
jgi:Skp family chaperone for outer membrane proteins